MKLFAFYVCKEKIIMSIRRAVAAIVCGVMTLGCLSGCGDKTSNGDSLYENVANFTSPVEGEEVIIMKIKDYGEVRIKLFPEYASKGVENFVELAKEGYYDGLTFHRVISDFMIQGGDPLGNGTGGESIWGSKFDGGTDEHLIHAAGAIAYANSGSTSTNGSQFYIVTGEVYDETTLSQMESYYGMSFSDDAKTIYSTVGGTPFLDGGYTVFGQVYEGLDIIFEIQNVETDDNDKPVEDVIMESVTVAEYSGEDVNWSVSE
jgi:cyclophilin family peptidyl-prolyl cis-trans isomerase